MALAYQPLPLPHAGVRVRSMHVSLAAELPDLADALANGGRRPWLFERPQGVSLLVVQSALTITARHGRARVQAHTALGRRFAHALGWRFQGAFAGLGAVDLDVRFDRATAHDAAARLKAPSPFDLLRALTFELAWEGDGPAPMLAGVLGFDHVDLFEALPAPAHDDVGFPDLIFALAQQAVLVDAAGHATAVVLAGPDDDGAAALASLVRRAEAARRLPPPPTAPESVPVTVDLDDAAYTALVRRMKDHVAAGDVFQIVPSRSFTAPCPDPFAAFRRLRALNPSPAMFHIEADGWTLFGGSPETALRVGTDRRVEVSPMAGTRRRGADAAEDVALEADLRADAKEVAEHMMLVDLARNDVARVSAKGTRVVDALLETKRFSHVMHLTSRVSGVLRADLDALHALAACMPMGTLSGAPKIRAMQLLRENEPDARGAYGGAVGWIAADGTMDTAIVIRSALVRDGIATVRAGAGVVADSVPELETAETRAKAASVLRALGVRP